MAGGILGMLGGAKSEPMKMEPFIAPDLSEKTERELLEMQTLAMLEMKHMFNQVLIAAQTNPLMSGFLPAP